VKTRIFALAVALAMPASAQAATYTYDFSPGTPVSVSIHPGYEAFVSFGVGITPVYGDLTVSPYTGYWSFYINTTVREPDGTIVPQVPIGEMGGTLFDYVERCGGLAICLPHHLHYAYSGAYELNVTQTLYFDGGFSQNFNMASLAGTLSVFVVETPIPAALPLFAAGLGMVAFVARRRKRAV